MADEKNYIHVHLACGAMARVSADITEAELIKLNMIAEKAMELTVGGRKKTGRLF